MNWIRLDDDLMRDDPRLLGLNFRAQILFLRLYTFAGKCEADGALIMHGKKLNDSDLMFHCRITDKRFWKSDMSSLLKSNLLNSNNHTYSITDWQKRQADWKVIREQRRERDNKYREKSRHVDDTSTTVPSSVDDASTKPNLTPTLPDKTPPPPSPSAVVKASAEKIGGGGGGGDGTLTPSQKQISDQIKPIWQAASLGGKQLEDILKELDIRNLTYEQARDLTLAALSDSYADVNAKNKAVVASHRILNGFAIECDPLKWGVIPPKVLAAAQVDLREAIGRRIFRAEEQEQIHSIPMPDDVREKLNQLTKEKQMDRMRKAKVLQAERMKAKEGTS
jgi:hypothetical protein